MDCQAPPTFPAGSLLAADYDEFLSGTAELALVFEPDEHSSLDNYAWTRDKLVLVTLVDVASHVELVTPGTWDRAPITGLPANTNTVIVAMTISATRCSWTQADSIHRRGCCGDARAPS